MEVVDRVRLVLADALDQERLGVIVLLELHEQQAELADRLRVRRVELDRLLVGVERLVEALLQAIDLAVRVPVQRLVRLVLHRLRERVLRLGLLALAVEQEAELEERAAVARIEIERLLEELARLVELVLISEGHAEQHVRLGVLVGELERGAELERGLVDLADLVQRGPEGLVEHGVLGVELHRAAQRLDRFLVLLEEQQRATATLVAVRVFVVDPDHLIGDLERLGALVPREQRRGVEAIAREVRRVAVVVDLRDLGGARRLARVQQEVDVLLEDLELLVDRVRLLVQLVGGLDLTRLRLVPRLREQLALLGLLLLGLRDLGRLLGTAARGH